MSMRMTTTTLSLDGVRMQPKALSEVGVISAETELIFEQVGDVFSARYRGGSIIDGYLIGKLQADGHLHFRYVQADRLGNLDAGASTGKLIRLSDGRLRLCENFQWITRPESGRNVFEELVQQE